MLLTSPFDFTGRSQGGAIRTRNIIKALTEKYNVVSVEFTWKQGDIYRVLESSDSTIALSCLHLDTISKGLGRNYDGAYSSWITPEMMGLIPLLIAVYKPALAWHEFSFMAPYEIPCSAELVPSILSLHNIESNIALQLERAATNPIGETGESSYPGDSASMKSIEDFHISKFKSIITTTKHDSDYCAAINPHATTAIAPNVVNLSPITSTNNEKLASQMNKTGNGESKIRKLALVFVGDCRYKPNSNGITWFISEIFDYLHNEIKAKLSIRIYGEGSLDMAETWSRAEISFCGYADSLDAAYAGADYSLIPLLQGGGSRLKAFEAIERGIGIITTPKGCEGIDIETLAPFVHSFTSAESFTHAISVAENQASDANTISERVLMFENFIQTAIETFKQSVHSIAESTAKGHES